MLKKISRALRKSIIPTHFEVYCKLWLNAVIKSRNLATYTIFVLTLITSYVMSLKLIIKLLATTTFTANILPILVTYIKPRVKKMVEFIRKDYSTRIGDTISIKISTKNNRQQQKLLSSELIDSAVCLISSTIECILFLNSILPTLIASSTIAVIIFLSLIYLKHKAESWVSQMTISTNVEIGRTQNILSQKSTYEESNNLSNNAIESSQKASKRQTTILSKSLIAESLGTLSDLAMFYTLILSPTLSAFIPIKSAIYVMELAKSMHSSTIHAQILETKCKSLGSPPDIIKSDPSSHSERLLLRMGVNLDNSSHQINPRVIPNRALIRGPNGAGKSTRAILYTWNILKSPNTRYEVRNPDLASKDNYNISSGESSMHKLLELVSEIKVLKKQSKQLILILDEPEKNQDTANRQTVTRILEEIANTLDNNDYLFIISHSFTKGNLSIIDLREEQLEARKRDFQSLQKNFLVAQRSY